PEPGRGAGVCAPTRNRIPGHDRELQRLVAGQGVVAFPAGPFEGPAGAFAQVRPGLAKTAGSADRGGSRPAGVFRSPEAGLETTSPWPPGLPATQRWKQRGDVAGTDLAPRPSVAQPPGPL